MNEIPKELTREALYELVWSKPMFKISAQFGVSGSYLTRVCLRLKVPRPGRGYWARIAAGEILPKPSLPIAKPGDEIAWAKGGGSVELPMQSVPLSVELEKPRFIPTKIRSTNYPLLIGMKSHFEAGKLSHEGNYLKPSKKLLIDLLSTKECLSKAFSFANKLFSSFEVYGYHAAIAPSSEKLIRVQPKELEYAYHFPNIETPWSPFRCTVVYIGTLAIGLTIFEMFEEAEARYENGQYVRIRHGGFSGKGHDTRGTSWTTKSHFPTGRLCLQAYSPYQRVNWTKQWKEEVNHNLVGRIGEIIKDIEHEAPELIRKINEGERQAEIEREQWRVQRDQWLKEDAERRSKKAIEDSSKELFQIIEKWDGANRIEQFFQDTERKAATLDDNEKLKVLERLKAARKFIDCVDALDYFMKWRTPEER